MVSFLSGNLVYWSGINMYIPDKEFLKPNLSVTFFFNKIYNYIFIEQHGSRYFTFVFFELAAAVFFFAGAVFFATGLAVALFLPGCKTRCMVEPISAGLSQT